MDMDMNLPAIARLTEANAPGLLKSYIDTHPVKAHENTIAPEVVAQATPKMDSNPGGSQGK